MGNTSLSEVEDFQDFFLNLAINATQWQPLYAASFAHTYHIDVADSVSQLTEQLEAEPALLSQYAKSAIAMAPSAPCGLSNCTAALYCELKETEVTSFQTCLN